METEFELTFATARSSFPWRLKSAAAFATLGWILEHDLVGRRFRKGCDLGGAEAAYRKAVELDASDYNNRVNLAIRAEDVVEDPRMVGGAR